MGAMSSRYRNLVAILFSVGVLLVLPMAAAQVVINEIDYDQPGTDTADFIELKNIGAAAVDLSTFQLVLVNGNGGSVYSTINLSSVSLVPGDYFVICGDTNTVANCDLQAIASIQNGGPDAVALLDGGTLVDTVSYEGDTIAPYTEGSGVGLEDISSGGAGGENEYKSISRTPDGNDTNQNNLDFAFRCMSPGETNLATNTGCLPPDVIAIVINEVDYQETGVSDNEFIELFNSGNTIINLDNYSVDLFDGTGATVYQSIDLPNVNLAAGGYYVICSTMAVTPCDLNTALGNNFIQDGAPDAVSLKLLGSVVDAVSYEGSAAAPYVEGSGVGLIDPEAETLAGISRFPDGIDSNSNSADFSARCSTPGAPNTSVATTCTGGTAIEIFTIQGNGLGSALVGQVVTTEDNIVTGVGVDGFFIQTPTARSDGDADTSDGLWIYTGAAPTVAVGDQVDVTGLVDEFFDFTEITSSPLVSIDSSGNALPAVVMLDSTLPSPNQPQSPIELERFEGMRVAVVGTTTGATDRFGDTPVTAQLMRSYREPGITYPGLPGLPVWDGNPEVFEINADAMGLPDTAMFGGQSVTAEGPLAFSFGDYQIWPTVLSVGAPPILPRAVPARGVGQFTIATQNFLRIFDTIDDPVTDDPIISAAEYQIRLTKASLQIRTTLGAPDIVAVQEVEKLLVLQDMAAQIAADQPGLNYSAHLIEGNDVGGIDVGYLTRDDTIAMISLAQHGANEILAFDGSLLNDRPPLVLDAQYIGPIGFNFDITVINVHQRSLGGIEGASATRVKTKRLAQAQSLAQLVQDMQTADPARHIVVTGDFNAFEFTDGYVDVMGQVTGNLDPLGDEFATTDIVNPDLTNQVLSLPAEERYSFIFQGSAQALDHTTTSQSLAPFVRDFQFSRGNADVAASALLLTGPGDPPIDDYTALRVSDHDGGVLYIVVDSDGDGIVDDMDNCTLVANADQRDTNTDGYGNRCDPDLNNDGIVNFGDVALWVPFFNTPTTGDADFNGDGFANFGDYVLYPAFFLNPPGPSGIAP